MASLPLLGHGGAWSNPGVFVGLEGQGKTHARPVPKGNPVNIPEPQWWTECNPPLFAWWAECWATGAWLIGRVEEIRGHSNGGNAKPTFGTLSVNPVRDLFSF